MQLIGTVELRRDAAVYSNAKKPVEAWIKVVEEATWANLMEVKQTYATADFVKGRTVFNIKGNHYRLITVIKYSLQIVVYQAFLTHVSYDQYNF